MKTSVSITGINTSITILADILQNARNILTSSKHKSFSSEETRRIILICLLYLHRINDSRCARSLSLSDVLYNLKLSPQHFFSSLNDADLKNIDLSEPLRILANILHCENSDELIVYSLEALEYDIDEYFGVKLNRGTRGSNQRKKNKGIYYTPLDVVNYMVSKCISNILLLKEFPSVLDCSCGTGIFLLQSFSFLEKEYNPNFDFDTSLILLKKCIWGIDISQSAIDSSKVVFLNYYLEKYAESDERLDEVWDLLDESFYVGDATCLQDALFKNKVFPKRFDCILGNPPYVTKGKDSNLFIPFVGNMMAFSSQKSCSALVLPLSICYSKGKEFINLRNRIQKDEGVTWSFMNFDRSPDSLFGDQVKTRNTILFRSTLSGKTSISTTTLQRWTSVSRSYLFSNLKLCDITGISLSSSVPKMSDSIEKQCFSMIEHMNSCLREMCLPTPTDYQLLVNGTAYNWICAYDHIPASTDEEDNEYVSSTSRVYYLPDNDARNFCVAVLNNRIAYWYWIVTGDGFHLNDSFLTDFRIGKSAFTESQYRELCMLGKEYSQRIKQFPTISYNAGKRIVNYSHWEAIDIVKNIEKLLVNSLRLPSSFVPFVEQWYFNQVNCNRIGEKR